MDNNDENKERFEYRVKQEDTLHSILERIRDTDNNELLLDITDNDLLRKDGSLRRTLVAAAAEFKKHLAFSFTEVGAVKKIEKKTTPAKSQKIPVAMSAGGSVGAISKAMVKMPKLGESGKKIAVTFSFFAGLLLAAAVFFLLPRAEIKITPEVEPVSMDLAIKASATALNADFENGILPAKILEAEENVDVAFPVKGFVEMGEKSSGRVTIINKTQEEQKIKGKSRLKAENGMIFTMDEPVIVAPKSSGVAKVSATEGGELGNLKSGKLIFAALTKADEDILYAEVLEPFSGGTEKKVPALTQQDIDEAKKQAIGEIGSTLQQKIEQGLGKEIVKDDRLMRLTSDKLEPVEKVGAQISEFHLQGKARAEYFAFSQTELITLVEQIVRARIGENKVIGKPLDFSVLVINKVDWDATAVFLSYPLQNIVHANLEVNSLRKKLSGRTIQGALDYLHSLSGVKDVSVKLSPFWVKRIPGFANNVKIELEIK